MTCRIIYHVMVYSYILHIYIVYLFHLVMCDYLFFLLLLHVYI